MAARLRRPHRCGPAGHRPIEVDLEPDRLERTNQSTRPNGVGGSGIRHARLQRLGDLVEHWAAHRISKLVGQLARIARQCGHELPSLPGQPRERGGIEIVLRLAQLGAEVDQRLELIGAMTHELVDEPRGGRWATQLLHQRRELTIITAQLARPLIARRRELVGRKCIELVCDGGERIGRHGLILAHERCGRKGPRNPSRHLAHVGSRP
ncbi:hypothetical protein [Agromyces ramosus]|uniref:HD domain-containing protein n=1 Tax=Agromyces ramosus TaxID=33879 RepID=A0ABU0RAL3_9MICO|nr:hypothetical protein [Agromyces ramosus]MDQ0895103.1 hypothetical protein [Agromyces ramosus]